MISIALPIFLAATSTPVGFTDDYDAALARAKAEGLRSLAKVVKLGRSSP